MTDETKNTDNCLNIKHGDEYVDHPPHYHPKCSDNEMKSIIDRIVKRGDILKQ